MNADCPVGIDCVKVQQLSVYSVPFTSLSFSSLTLPISPPIDCITAMMLLYRLRRKKIITTVLCCVVYTYNTMAVAQ